MSCEAWAFQISELIDGTISEESRAALDLHLRECSGCRELAADLAHIREAAGSLAVLVPPEHAWTGIARRLRAERQVAYPSSARQAGRAETIAWRWLAAAAVLLVLAGSSWILLRRSGTEPAQTGGIGSPAASPRRVEGQSANADSGELVESVESELRLAEEHYEKAIGGLEQIAKSERGSLDPQLTATLQKNLAVIDQAIAESRVALRAQPESRPAQESLFEGLRKKVSLLQDTIALMNEMRKGDQAGAARIVEGLDKL